MPTLDEQFEEWRKAYELDIAVINPETIARRFFYAGAAAGAKEEREQLLQAIRGCLEQVRPFMCITVSEVMERIERRIRQCGEEAEHA